MLDKIKYFPVDSPHSIQCNISKDTLLKELNYWFNTELKESYYTKSKVYGTINKDLFKIRYRVKINTGKRQLYSDRYYLLGMIEKNSDKTCTVTYQKVYEKLPNDYAKVLWPLFAVYLIILDPSLFMFGFSSLILLPRLGFWLYIYYMGKGKKEEAIPIKLIFEKFIEENANI